MKKRIVELVILLSLIIIPQVNAKSEYYDYVWEDDVGVHSYASNGNRIYDSENDAHITNDIVKTTDGYLTIGFGHEFGDTPIIRKLDNEGNLISTIEIPESINGKLKEIIPIDDNYYITGISGGRNSIFIIKLNSNLAYENIAYVDTTTSYDFNTMELYTEETEDDIYVFNPFNANEYVIRFSKDLSSNEELSYTSLTGDIKETIDNYLKIKDLYDDLITGGNHIFPVFCKKYQGGYLYSLYNYNPDNKTGYLYYYKDNQEVWKKETSNTFYRDATTFRDYVLLISSTPSDTESHIETVKDSHFILLDESGTEIGNDLITNYIDEYYQSFIPEHLISFNSGFAVTGLANNETCLTENSVKEVVCQLNKIIYFSYIFNITTKTDGNGTLVSSNTTSLSGNEITFTITPNKGYVLDNVKVTDNEGNTIVFTSNTFTMPSSDVTIEASFKVENPNTSNILSISILILAITFGMILLKVKKKLNWLKK